MGGHIPKCDISPLIIATFTKQVAGNASSESELIKELQAHH